MTPSSPYAQSVALHQVLTGARVPNRLVTVEGGTHGRNWFRVSDAAAWQRALVEWLNSYLQP